MAFFSLEHRKATYWADFVIYGAVAMLLAVVLRWASPPPQRWLLLGCVVLGMAAWTPLEYVLHRFVLHGLKPFSQWHALHHERPKALIFSPTWLSASLMASLVFFPLCLFSDRWLAMGLTLGLLLGYQTYALTHHFLHHEPMTCDSRRALAPKGRWQIWLAQRKRWHARHHHSLPLKHYGVTTDLWDRLFRTCADLITTAPVPKTPPPIAENGPTPVAGHLIVRPGSVGVKRRVV